MHRVWIARVVFQLMLAVRPNTVGFPLGFQASLPPRNEKIHAPVPLWHATRADLLAGIDWSVQRTLAGWLDRGGDACDWSVLRRVTEAHCELAPFQLLMAPCLFA